MRKDFSECKEWLQESHPILYQQLYGEPVVVKESVKSDVIKEGEPK